MTTVKMEKMDSRRFGFFVVAVALFHFLVMPGTVLTLHAESLSVSPLLFLGLSFVISIVLGTIFYGLFRKSPNSLLILLTILGVLSVLLAFYNFYFLDYRGKVVDADPDVFDNRYTTLQLTGMAAATCLTVFAALKFRSLLWQALCIFVFATGASMLVSTITSSKTPQASASDTRTTVSANAFSYSTENNIIHIILDGMESDVFNTVIRENPELIDQFQGFDYFPDTLAASEITYLSMGSVFSGTAYTGQDDILDYLLGNGLDDADKDKTVAYAPIFSDLASANYDLDIITGGGSGLKPRDIYRSHIMTEFEDITGQDDGIKKLIDLTLVKTMPWIAKRKVYNNGQWLFSRSKQDLPRANRASKFLKTYERRITKDNSKPTYKLIHLISPHGPWTSAPDCSPLDTPGKDLESISAQTKCASIALANFLDGISAAGLYDNSTIIVHGDHGICFRKKPSMPGPRKNIPRCFGNANPLLMVKPANSNDPFEVNSAQISLIDIPEIIRGAVSGNTAKTIRTKYSHVERSRDFYVFQPNRVEGYKNGRFDSAIKYQVSGPLENPESWTKLEIDLSKTAAPTLDDVGPADDPTASPDEQTTLDNQEIITIEKMGQNNVGTWVLYSAGTVTKQMNIKCGSEETNIVLKDGHFTFKTPSTFPDCDIYLVDDEGGKQQQIDLPKPQ